MPDLFRSFACRCESCAPGDSGPTYTRKFMRETLVRSIAANSTRAPFLRDYAKHHGDAEAEKLADEVRAEIGRRRNANQT